MTFYYTNQQSARLMFYHDHAWGITRLNVYAGEAAGYLITDPTEQKLIANGTIPAGPDPAGHPGPHLRARTPAARDSARPSRTRPGTTARWGGDGQPVVPPRLHAGPESRRPERHERLRALDVRALVLAARRPPQHGPIANPYYDPNCNLDDPATWQYETDPFCEPPLIPGTPNISAGMEQFNDTPIVNGTAYPTDHRGAEGLPLPHPERGQRPLLEPAVVRG